MKNYNSKFKILTKSRADIFKYITPILFIILIFTFLFLHFPVNTAQAEDCVIDEKKGIFCEGFTTPKKLPTGEINQELIDQLRKQPQENTDGLNYIKLPGEDRVYTTRDAEQKGLVSCGPIVNEKGIDINSGNPCTFCDLLKTADKVFNFAIWSIAIPLVVIMIIYGGFVIMTAGDSTDKTAQGRKIIQSSIIGVIIVLGAWLIISEVLVAIAEPGYRFNPSKIFSFSKFTCS